MSAFPYTSAFALSLAPALPLAPTLSLPRKREREPRSRMNVSVARQNRATFVAKALTPTHRGGPSSRSRGEERRGASPTHALVSP